MSVTQAPPALKIRRARRVDAAEIANLSAQLGYPATPAQIRSRLTRLQPPSQHALLIAESPAGIVGWLHVSIRYLIESETLAEVNGLVVREDQRGLGAGAKLLAAAEEWARKQRCAAVNVRSNVIRDRAHAFYLREGYDHYKTQKAFRKPL